MERVKVGKNGMRKVGTNGDGEDRRKIKDRYE